MMVNVMSQALLGGAAGPSGATATASLSLLATGATLLLLVDFLSSSYSHPVGIDMFESHACHF